MRKLTRKEIKVFVAALAGCVILLFLSRFLLFGPKGNEVVVTIQGEEYGRYSLAEDTEVVISYGSYENTLVITDGYATVTDANCQDLLCVYQKKILPLC